LGRWPHQERTAGTVLKREGSCRFPSVVLLPDDNVMAGSAERSRFVFSISQRGGPHVANQGTQSVDQQEVGCIGTPCAGAGGTTDTDARAGDAAAGRAQATAAGSARAGPGRRAEVEGDGRAGED